MNGTAHNIFLMKIRNHENEINLNFHFIEEFLIPSINEVNQDGKSFDKVFNWRREVKSAWDGIEVCDELFQLVLVFFPQVKVDKISQEFLFIIDNVSNTTWMKPLPFFLIICVSIDYEIHGLDKRIILFDIEGSDKVPLTAKIDNKGNTEIEVRKVCFLIKKEVYVAARVVFILWEL